MLSKEQEATKARIALLDEQVVQLKKSLAELKVILKGRFGDAISLDK
jgi:chaperonin cofactor prefoldin